MYYHKITEYGIKCCMHAHHVAPRALPSRGELYRCKTLFLNDFPIFFFYPNGTWTHPPTSKLFLDFWNFFNFAKPRKIETLHFNSDTNRLKINEIEDYCRWYAPIEINAEFECKIHQSVDKSMCYTFDVYFNYLF